MGNVKGKTVMEYGCNVGTLTMHLAEEVGKKDDKLADFTIASDLNSSFNETIWFPNK